MKRCILISLFLGLLSFPAKGLGFSLTVTPTHQTCQNNGALNFSVSNTDPAGSITYRVYRLPDTTSPIAVQTTTTVSQLGAGNYRVIATETVGNNSSQQTVDVTINNNIQQLAFTVNSTNQACSSVSNIVVNVTSGTAVSYAIISGPVTYPPQPSPNFSNLPADTYDIRVIDACGNGRVQSFTVALNTAGLNIGTPTFSNTSPPSCAFTVVTNAITPAAGTVIGYPLDIRYTVFPPASGTPVISNSNVNSGNATAQDVSTTIPSYGNQAYSYEIEIRDACGSTYRRTFPVNPQITLTATIVPINCNRNYFILNTTNFTPPYNLNFTSFPAGFNPAATPGPYTTPSVTFGGPNNPAPIGNYDVTITDACGRQRSLTFQVPDLPPQPTGVGNNNGCLTNSGNIVISIPNYELVTAIVIQAPTAYPFPTPHDVTASVGANHVLVLNPVPLGNYTIQLTDECGNVIPPYSVIVPPYVDQRLQAAQRPGCAFNKGSVRVWSGNGKLTSITITAAPPGFATPFNGTSNIAAAEGVFYMNNLDPGSYTFSATDECNFTNSITITVDGYAITASNFSIQDNCGSFNVPLNFTSNATTNQTFWLQKLIDPATNTWGHPGTLVPYPDGSVPNSNNSRPLVNNTSNLNNAYNGTFRIVRSFSSFNNGSEINNNTVSTADKNCIEYLSPTLTFNQSFALTDIYRMSCSSSGTRDVVIVATGSGPLHYYITSPTYIDNGNSNVFPGLPAGTYSVSVEDSCGNIASSGFDVNSLISLVSITRPDDMVLCRPFISGAEVFDISTQNAMVLGPQSPTEYTLTYHTSLASAQDGTGAIPQANLVSYNPATNPQTIYARVIFNQLPGCYETTSFELIVGQEPLVNLQPEYVNCSTAPITLNAATGLGHNASTTYLWSDGTTTPTNVVSALGQTNLTVTATNSYGTPPRPCSTTRAVTVFISQPPVVERIETVDWTENENSITVLSTNPAAFEYALDGVNFQDENTFSGLVPGVYTVTVRDKARCGTIQKVVWLLNYPKFFTPNGDGINETWYIRNQQFEPDFTVYIYDRYGKFIKQFKSNTTGWDGTYNGQQNFSTDYWFVVHRQDGRIHKGHFTLKR